MAEPVIRFIGKGTEHHNGIPARDLTTEEYDALDTAQRETVRSSPIYDYAAYRDALKAARDAAKTADEPVREPSPASPKKDDTKK